jgi:KDO2-lipid IV(A) lauroyltransferase
MSEEKAKNTRFVRPKDLDSEQRATIGARILWRIEAIAWDVLYWYPMKLLPITWASSVMAGLLGAVGPLISPHRTMMRNLRMCFPDWTSDQIRKVARGAWKTMGRTVGEMPHLAELKPYTPNARVEVVGAERLDAIRASGKPAIFISGHFANWEILGASVSGRLPDAQITYRPANNPHIDRRIAKARSTYTDILTPKGAGTRELVRALSRGQSVALMNDQKFNQGIAVPFFGYDAMTAPGPTRFALKFNAPIVPVSCKRIGPARYRITIQEPFHPTPDADEHKAIHDSVLHINQWVEATIREAPEQWFWMHNRWPKEAWIKAGVM